MKLRNKIDSKVYNILYYTVYYIITHFYCFVTHFLNTNKIQHFVSSLSFYNELNNEIKDLIKNTNRSQV